MASVSRSQCSTTSKAATTSNVWSANGSASADPHTPSPGVSPRGNRSSVIRRWPPFIQPTLGPSALPTSRIVAGSPEVRPQDRVQQLGAGAEPPVVGLVQGRGAGLCGWSDHGQTVADADTEARKVSTTRSRSSAPSSL